MPMRPAMRKKEENCIAGENSRLRMVYSSQYGLVQLFFYFALGCYPSPGIIGQQVDNCFVSILCTSLAVRDLYQSGKSICPSRSAPPGRSSEQAGHSGADMRATCRISVLYIKVENDARQDGPASRGKGRTHQMGRRMPTTLRADSFEAGNIRQGANFIASRTFDNESNYGYGYIVIVALLCL
ncbi:hypothetical protein CCM_05092 [Cordyceps militaris CM01]|uniref:Uncharacterized protein n=1 Tax=Cordyceps militaris (strain CM01) TaxID=983644 RepID=G3JHT0_CORMM|nr:uncharacterized protein CCM_05092 [Cordyceps militaris CM01]EGX90936.1 hypothetical protein CCM_05092 [Cordyceps militaris CM01]